MADGDDSIPPTTSTPPILPPETPPALPTPAAKDRASDAAGEPRADGETPPPPGTATTTFWQHSGTKVAISATLVIGAMFLRAWIMDVPISKEGLAIAAEIGLWAWAAAFGISRTSTDSLRWK